MELVIHGQSSLISQFLQPTNFEITGITKNPVILKEIVNIKISDVYRVININIPIANGMNQFGTTIQIFLLNTFLNDLLDFFLTSLA